MPEGQVADEADVAVETSKLSPDAVVGVHAQRHPLAAAAIVGGALAATAGAYLGTRALARRNGAREGKPVNSVMAAAITACDLKTGPGGDGK